MKLNTPGVSTVRSSPGLAIDNFHRAEMRVAVHPADCRVADQFDVGGLLDPMHQVAGHVLVQIISPEQEQDVAGVRGEKDRRLPGRIPATHNYDRIARAQLGLGQGCGIVDAGSLESLGALHA